MKLSAASGLFLFLFLQDSCGPQTGYNFRRRCLVFPPLWRAARTKCRSTIRRRSRRP